ncbi:MAG: RNA polymerase sigma factor [Candidatus Kapabacteria bacterium]|nr:RNA polymerase sigma factor [Candidatus Kapabacteria bacterium]
MTLHFPSMSDSDLFSLLSGAERERAFSEIYGRYNRRVYAYCRTILGDSVRADDVFQETFLSFLRSAERGTAVDNVLAYLLRIARNHCLNAKARERFVLDSEDVLDALSVQPSVETDELHNVVRIALDVLPEHHREAVVLQMYDEMSYEEIGVVMDVPVSTVRNWVVRGKRRLRNVLSSYLGTDAPASIHQREE